MKQLKKPKIRLEDHRKRLKEIAPTDQQIEALSNRLAKHLNDSGFAGGKQTKAIRDKIVEFLLTAQNHEPYFWVIVPGCLPFCWNKPDQWDDSFTHIVYEWGHIDPRNNEEDPKIGRAGIENLCLMSSRCNNHIQSSLPMSELRRYFDGSKIAHRIDQVTDKRNKLFASPLWKNLMTELERNPKRIATKKLESKAGL